MNPNHANNITELSNMNDITLNKIISEIRPTEDNMLVRYRKILDELVKIFHQSDLKPAEVFKGFLWKRYYDQH